MDGLKFIHIILLAGLVAHTASDDKSTTQINQTENTTNTTNLTSTVYTSSSESTTNKPITTHTKASSTSSSNPSCLLEHKNTQLAIFILGALVLACVGLLVATIALACQVCYLQQQRRHVHFTRTNADVIRSREAADGHCSEVGPMLPDIEMEDRSVEDLKKGSDTDGDPKQGAPQTDNVHEAGGTQETETVPTTTLTPAEPIAPLAEETPPTPPTDTADTVIEL